MDPRSAAGLGMGGGPPFTGLSARLPSDCSPEEPLSESEVKSSSVRGGGGRPGWFRAGSRLLLCAFLVLTEARTLVLGRAARGDSRILCGEGTCTLYCTVYTVLYCTVPRD